MTDVKSKLHRGDQLLREGRYAEAVAEYEGVATVFAETGFALKAVAMFKTIVEIIDRSAPELAESRTRALLGLNEGVTALGLSSDAEATRRRLGSS